MPRKPRPKPDDPEQSKRFIETAEEVGADRRGGSVGARVQEDCSGHKETTIRKSLIVQNAYALENMRPDAHRGNLCRLKSSAILT